VTPEEILLELDAQAEGELIVFVNDPPRRPSRAPWGYKKDGTPKKRPGKPPPPPSGIVHIDDPRKLSRIGLSAEQIKHQAKIRITTNALVRHIDRETRGGVEIAEIALGIMRDPAARPQDRLTAIDWVANRVFGLAAKEDVAELVQKQLDSEKEKLLIALRGALSEDDVRRIESAMSVSRRTTLVRVETRGRSKGS
jgi:hypothetical protein